MNPELEVEVQAVQKHRLCRQEILRHPVGSGCPTRQFQNFEEVCVNAHFEDSCDLCRSGREYFYLPSIHKLHIFRRTIGQQNENMNSLKLDLSFK